MVPINRNPSQRQLRQFGFVWLGFVAFFGAVAWLRFDAPGIAIGLWAAAVVVPVVGWLAPSFMRVVFVGMSVLAWPIGFVVSHIVLAAVYFLVVTPIGIGLRLVGYDPMRRRATTRGTTGYWVAREGRRDAESYFRQF